MNINIDELERLASAVSGWSNCSQAWLDTSEDDTAAVVGHINEDGATYPVATIDCDQYYHGGDSLPLAKFYAAANPATVLELIGEVRRLRAELAASQAREVALRKALEECLSWVDAWCDTSPETCFEVVEQEANNALLLPSDDTALRQAIRAAKEEIRERCAVLCESYQWNAETCAAGIRALEVE